MGRHSLLARCLDAACRSETVEEVSPGSCGQGLGRGVTVAADEHGSPCNLLRIVRFDHIHYGVRYRPPNRLRSCPPTLILSCTSLRLFTQGLTTKTRRSGYSKRPTNNIRLVCNTYELTRSGTGCVQTRATPICCAEWGCPNDPDTPS
jgi:hypothetical protein